MNLLNYLWSYFLYLFEERMGDPQDPTNTQEMEFLLNPKDIYSAANNERYFVTKLDSIQEYIQTLEYFISCFSDKVLINKAILPVGERRILCPMFFANKNGYLINPSNSFVVFLAKVQELEALYFCTNELDHQYLVDTNLDTNLRWSASVLNNAITVVQFFIKDFND